MRAAILAILASCARYHATIAIAPERGYPAIRQFVSDGDSIPLSIGVCGADVARIDEHVDHGAFHAEVDCSHPGLPDPDAAQPVRLR